MLRRTQSSKSMRLWPALVIASLALLIIGWVWLVSDSIRQMKVQTTILCVFIAIVSLLLWVTFSSQFAPKTRSRVWMALLAGMVLFFGLFRYRGITGDFVPLFEVRWKAKVKQLSGARLTRAISSYEYPQFLGPSRNGNVHGVHIARDWSSHPPKLIWRRPVGKGWSGFAVVGNLAVTQEQHGEQYRVVCYDLGTGEIKWSSVESGAYVSLVSGDGPRSTPTIVDRQVYTLGAGGMLSARHLQNGERIWSRDILEDNGATEPQWGISCSPLVVDGMVVVSAGGSGDRSLVAYDEKTGEIVWRGGNDRSGYSSPLIATLAGIRQIIIFNAGSIAGHDPTNGKVLWSYPWPAEQPNVAQPVPLPENRLLASSGYGVGSKLLEIKPSPDGGLEALLIWESTRLKAKFTNLVVHEGLIYGLDDGILVCFDPATGERRWKRGRYGHGQVLLVEDLLLVQTEKGEIVLVDPNPQALEELARFRVMEGKLWNSPTLVGPYLLVRSDREAALFELPGP